MTLTKASVPGISCFPTFNVSRSDLPINASAASQVAFSALYSLNRASFPSGLISAFRYISGIMAQLSEQDVDKSIPIVAKIKINFIIHYLH